MRKQTIHTATGLFALLAMTAGCAITDYGGRGGEQTEGEAKLWGKEVAFTGFGPQDGTYSYTVRYNQKAGAGAVTINSYLNPGIISFSRDGLVDRDGDDVQGRAGAAGGTFNTGVRSVDPTPGTPCEFFANIVQDKTGGAGIALCISGAVEEVDKDLLLQDPFASLDDLASQIWSGSLASSFNATLNSITLNGTTVALSGVSLDLSHNGMRPTNMALDGSSPGGQELLQAILDNTVHGEATSIGVGLDGGLGFDLPSSITAAFDHDAISAAIN